MAKVTVREAISQAQAACTAACDALRSSAIMYGFDGRLTADQEAHLSLLRQEANQAQAALDAILDTPIATRTSASIKL